MWKILIRLNGKSVVRVASGVAKNLQKRIYQAPEKIEYKGGIFIYESERLTVLAMLLENLGIDNAVQLGNLEDWKAAIADFEQQRNESQIKGG